MFNVYSWKYFQKNVIKTLKIFYENYLWEDIILENVKLFS